MVEGRSGRRHVQTGWRIGKTLLQGEPSVASRPNDRLLPHRRAEQPHLVCAQILAGLWQREELRRLLDGVGQHGRCANRPRRAAGWASDPIYAADGYGADGGNTWPATPRPTWIKSYPSSRIVSRASVWNFVWNLRRICHRCPSAIEPSATLACIAFLNAKHRSSFGWKSSTRTFRFTPTSPRKHQP